MREKNIGKSHAKPINYIRGLDFFPTAWTVMESF